MLISKLSLKRLQPDLNHEKSCLKFVHKTAVFSLKAFNSVAVLNNFPKTVTKDCESQNKII